MLSDVLGDEHSDAEVKDRKLGARHGVKPAEGKHEESKFWLGICQCLSSKGDP